MLALRNQGRDGQENGRTRVKVFGSLSENPPWGTARYRDQRGTIDQYADQSCAQLQPGAHLVRQNKTESRTKKDGCATEIDIPQRWQDDDRQNETGVAKRRTQSREIA